VARRAFGPRGACGQARRLPGTPQAFIEKLMLMAVQEGRRGAPQGGDPFIFGRGGEEVEHLRAPQAWSAGHQYHRGAGLTSLGAPLTHRDRAHGVVFITGHAKPGDAGTDWRQLAATAQAAKLTLVVYMGVAAAGRLRPSCCAGGLAADTPVAAIQHASLPQQRHALTCLADLPAALAREQLGSPVCW
jgi:uroporphyrin-III C-methyltransferase